MAPSEHETSYEVRREAASAAVVAVGLLAGLAALSRQEGWELMGLPWWSWLALAVPGLVLCADLWLGARRIGFAGTRAAAIVLLGLIVLGNIVGVCVLVAALVTTKNDDLDGVQLLVTTGVIWAANIIVFGLCYWDLDDGGSQSAPSGGADNDRADTVQPGARAGAGARAEQDSQDHPAADFIQSTAGSSESKKEQ